MLASITGSSSSSMYSYSSIGGIFTGPLGSSFRCSSCFGSLPVGAGCFSPKSGSLSSGLICAFGLNCGKMLGRFCVVVVVDATVVVVVGTVVADVVGEGDC